MADKKRFTSSRKLDHLRICAEKDVESGDAGFSDIRFVHNALPECDMGKIDLTSRFLNHTFSSPLFISAMTGGHPGTKETNARLARAAERYGIGMGVGSQRAALENPSLADTFSVVRDEAPRAFLVANLGVVQLRDHGIEWAERAVGMIGADAIAIHLNFLQEAIQPEGDHNATGCLAAIEELAKDFKKPVIVKETGVRDLCRNGPPVLGCGCPRDRYRRLGRHVLGCSRECPGGREWQCGRQEPQDAWRRVCRMGHPHGSQPGRGACNGQPGDCIGRRPERP